MTEATGQRVVGDADQRAAALDVGRSFIVQAPAGSGKTELLTQRFLRLLARVAEPEEIVAITFTRKAAAEMRNRVLAAFDAAAGPPPGQPHRRLTWELARDALDQDGRQGWALAANPARLRIQTFDSLAHLLARQMPLQSELGATPSTTERAGPWYRAAARATLQLLEDPDLGDDVARLLVHLDNRVGRLEDLLSAMLARRDQWLSHVVAAPSADELAEGFAHVVAAELRRLSAECPPDWLRGLLDSAAEAAGHLHGAGAAAPGSARFVDPGAVAPPGTDWDDLPAWQWLADLLLTGSGTPRRAWNARQGFPAPSESGLDADARTRRAALKQSMGELVARLREAPALLDRWVAVQRLPPRGPDPDQGRVLASLYRVLLRAAAELQLVFQQQGEVDFTEIQLRAQRALGSPVEPTDLALSLDYRLQHLLVDEFQDTSTGQYRLLETLTAGWTPGDGRTLFAVGDPMQSIYRFREAEVGLFLAARAHGIGGLRPAPLQLTVNFRSIGSIVDWVNGAFPQILPAEADIARGAVPYAAAVAHDRRRDPAAVQLHPGVEHDPAAEAAQVVALVRAALAETDSGTVAVLARARRHLARIATALGRADIRFQALDVEPLARQPVVRDLHALTRALLHPADRLAWLVVLRAPWLGLSLDDLVAIAEPAADCIPARLREPAVQADLGADGRARVARLLDVVGTALPARGRQPLRQWVEGVWLRLGGLAVAGARGEQDAQAYLALLDRHARAGGIDDFGALDEALAELYAAPDPYADGRVQLMTMHKAKGLEFDTVILPGLGRGARGDAAELMYWTELPDEGGGTHLLMAPVRASEQDTEPLSDYLRALEKERAQLESARLLYVAATRARRRLHLFGHVGVDGNGATADRPRRGSLLDRLWPVVADRFDDLQPAPAAPDGDAPVRLGTLSRLPADWAPAALGRPPGPGPGAPDPVRPIEFDWAGESARHVGTLVHRFLERIARDGPAQWPDARVAALLPRLRAALRHLGVHRTEIPAAADRALRALRQTLADETGRWILGDHAGARCEWPLTWYDDAPRHFVVDRAFVDEDGRRWIVDYKTGEHLEGDRAAFLDREQERYREQLETYARVVRELEDRPIRLALYFPLFPDWRCWDFDG